MPGRTTPLLRAASQVLHAPDEASALRVIAQGIHEAGWHSILAHLYDEAWNITHTATVNIPDEELAALDSKSMAPDERASTFGPEYDQFRVSRSYFFPADHRNRRVLRTMYIPQPADPAPGDWHPDDAAHVPLRCIKGDVIGRITIDAPYDGKRPTEQAFANLEAFADLAVLGILRLRAQAGQHKAEHENKSIINSVAAIILITDANHNCTFFNEEWFRFTRCDRGTDLTNAVTANCHPDDEEAMNAAFYLAAAAHEPFDLEYRLRRHDGEYRWVVEHGRPRFDATGEFAGYVCSALDITALRKASDDLQQERDRLSLAIEASGGGLWSAEYAGAQPLSTDPEMRTVSPKIYEITGCKPEELPDANAWDALVHPDDREHKIHQDEEHVAGRLPSVAREYRVRHKDGSYRWVRSNYLTRRGDRGEPLYQVGLVVDITEQKHAEETLQRERDHLALAIEASGGGLWDAEFSSDNPFGSGKIQSLSPRIKAIAGYAPDELPDTVAAWDALVVPEDVKTKDEQDRKHIAGDLPNVAREYRIRHKDGSIRWVRSSYLSRRDADNIPTYIVGFIMDVTAQKRTESELRQLLERERFLVAELDHRVRNTLSGLLSLIDMTCTPTMTYDYTRTIGARVRSMVTAHNLMSATRWHPIDLADLLHHLAPANTPGRLKYERQSVRIPARQATAFAMLLNELITNSLKYGALGHTGGVIHVQWARRCDVPHDSGFPLRLEWVETGGPQPKSETPSGLGLKLITGFAKAELAGAARLSFPPAGAHHIIDVCLDELTDDTEAEANRATVSL